MGADLYIDTLYQPHHKKWKRKFDKAVKRRDGLAEVEAAYSKMHERGYFRDPYNNNNPLWKFGLSWWDDVIPMLDAERDLSPAQAKKLLSILKENQIFEMSLKKLSPDERKYYLDRYADLQKFLNQAIELGEPIQASL